MDGRTDPNIESLVRDSKEIIDGWTVNSILILRSWLGALLFIRWIWGINWSFNEFLQNWTINLRINFLYFLHFDSHWRSDGHTYIHRDGQTKRLIEVHLSVRWSVHRSVRRSVLWSVVCCAFFCLDEISFQRDYKSCRIGVVVVVRSMCHIYGNFAII